MVTESPPKTKKKSLKYLDLKKFKKIAINFRRRRKEQHGEENKKGETNDGDD